VIVRGNHDASRDLSILGALEATHEITVCEQPEVVDVAGVLVQCLPWPRTAELAAKGLAGQALDEVAREALRDVLRGLEAQARSAKTYGDQPVALATHALITGCVTSHGQPLVGGELGIGLADLALARADVVVAGHIHKPQSWACADAEILYCGSPFRTSFGEHEEKSVVRLVLSASETRVERIATPAQLMIDVAARWNGAAFEVGADEGALTACDDVSGHQVRFRYTVASEHREAARAAALTQRDKWLEQGAERVVVEPEVVATSTARAPEIARATSVRAQLETLWTTRDDRPADADAVLLALSEIEAEVANG
jgi:exonuclease SbcD